MGYGLSRMERFRVRREDAQSAGDRNSPRKKAERARRDARLAALLARGTWPYTPTVLCWLGKRLNKPVHRLTPDDVKTVLG